MSAIMSTVSVSISAVSVSIPIAVSSIAAAIAVPSVASGSLRRLSVAASRRSRVLLAAPRTRGPRCPRVSTKYPYSMYALAYQE